MTVVIQIGNWAIKETKKHIENVRKLLQWVVSDLENRGKVHDQSKLQDPEVEGFLSTTNTLKGLTYGSEEYKEALSAMKPFLDHHYEHNSHHPEHHEKGVDDMNLLQIIEMLCDWKAATLRHADGDILRSIEINAKRFNMSPQLTQIFKNTVPFLEEIEDQLEHGE